MSFSRKIITAFLATTTLLMTNAFLAAEDDPWIGVEIMPKYGMGNGHFFQIEGREVYPVFPATVEKVKGKWLWVDGGWIDKADAVSNSDAMEYYTSAINQDPKDRSGNLSIWYGFRGYLWAQRGD